MNLYINRNPVIGPWGGGNLFVSAMYNLAPIQKFPHLEKINIIEANTSIVPNIILLAAFDADGNNMSASNAVLYKQTVNPDVKLVLRVNENDARKNTNHVDNQLLELSKHIDATVFVSNWIKEYFLQKGWACKNNAVIYNGCDSEIFRPQPKFNNGKVNIVAHHWSDNHLKGFDIYNKLDEFIGTSEGSNFTFTYIGRERGTFKNTKIISPLFGKELGDELGRYDVYVSASRFDPGPNHILEAIQCGLTTLVHKDGGGCVEFAGPGFVYDDWDSLKKKLFNFKHGDYRVPPDWSWQYCVNEYVYFMKDVCNGK